MVEKGIIVGKDQIQIDESILDVLYQEHNYDKDKTINDLKRNKFNNATTTYYLILKKKARTLNLK